MDYTLHRNLTYLLWMDAQSPGEWPQMLAELLFVSRERAQTLLDGEPLTTDEITRLAARFGVSPEEVKGVPLWQRAQVDVLKANLARVLSEIAHGTKQFVAHEVGVKPITLSRWSEGKQVPEEGHQELLAKVLGLPNADALRDAPLFLEARPVTLEARRQRIIEQIKAMPAERLHPLLPALEKLMR